MARVDAPRRRRRKRRASAEDYSSENANGSPLAAPEVDMREMAPRKAIIGRRMPLFVASIGLSTTLAGLALGSLSALEQPPQQSPIVEAAGAIGFSPANIVILGLGLVIGGLLLGRSAAVENRVLRGFDGTEELSRQLESLSRGLEEFRAKLESMRSDRVAATLNQIRYEVSSLHEKVHRELFPTEGERRDREAGPGLQARLESIRVAVESGASTAGKGLDNLAGLVERLEREVRDLDRKANQILSLSTVVQEKSEGRDSAASVRGSAAESTTSDLTGNEADAESAAQAPSGSRLVVGGDKPSAPPTQPDSTFRSAVERLKNLRG